MKIDYVVLKIFVSVTLLIFLSCSQKSKENDVHIVPVGQYDYHGNPLPAVIYYAEFNFIVDSVGQVYFYKQKENRMICGTGRDSFELPEYINLTPLDIIQVPENGIEDFIKLNIVNSTYNRKAITIGSVKDTIKSKPLTKMFSFFKDSTYQLPRLFRRATFEERIVLKYYQSGDYFNPNDINWDSTQIKMHENIEPDK